MLTDTCIEAVNRSQTRNVIAELIGVFIGLIIVGLINWFIYRRITR